MSQIQLPNCKNCGIKLDESNRAYRLNSCRDCYNKYKRRVNTANYQKHVEDVKQYHYAYHLKNRYGLDEETFARKIETQLHGCAICKLPFDEEWKVVVDHDHATNVVRDLLCHRCNIILGHVENDEALIFTCIEYLKRHAIRVA